MNMGLILVLSFIIAGALSALLTPVAIKIAPKIGAMDVPKDQRRMHSKPMPRFGGFAIFIAVSLTVLFNMREFGDKRIYFILAGGLLIYLLGIIDDLKNLPAKVKFLIEIAISIGLYFSGLRIEFIKNFFGTGHMNFGAIVCFIFTVLWITGITNTVNLIDGLDGLATGTSAIASLSIAYVAYRNGMFAVSASMLALAGATIGFLPFNFYPAKIFMGDGGSLFLGYMLATISIIGPIKGATIVAVIVPVLVLGFPIFDTLFAIIRRLANKRPIMEADKGHLHHRLMRLGYGQRRATLTLYCVSGIMGVAAITLSSGQYLETLALFGITFVMIYIFLTDPNHLKPQIKNPEEPGKAEEKKEN